MNTETVLVTGAAGFIGSHLCERLLQQGRTVIGVDNFDPFYDPSLKQDNVQRLDVQRLDAQRLEDGSKRFQLRTIDVTDREAMLALAADVQPRAVFHLAALAGVRPSIANPDRYARVNIDGTLNVLDAARHAECRTIVFASSSSVYGNSRAIPFTEDDPADQPISPYASTKRAAELICHSYSHLFGLSIACLRFFTVFGPAQRPDLAIARFMKLIDAGEEIEMFGDGSSSRDYTYIDDVIDGTIAAWRRVSEHHADNEGFFRIWNLGNSHPITLRDMIDTIADILGKPARIRQSPMQPGDVDRTCADLNRSAPELGYEPKVSFREGLERQWRFACGQATRARV